MEEEKNHSNWCEQILRALQEGKVTTEIVFDGTRYSVTLQPYDPPTAPKPFMGAHVRDVCSMCGQLIYQYTNSTTWFHVDPLRHTHEGVPLYNKPQD